MCSLAQAVPISKFKVTKTKNIDPSDRPFAVYKFRYRSAKALKSMGLIPQTPKPIPLEERPIEELTLEETRELLRRQSVSSPLSMSHTCADEPLGAICKGRYHQERD